jgi:hypothetical protein
MSPHSRDTPGAVPANYDERLAERLILDELFDLSLYRQLREHASSEFARLSTTSSRSNRATSFSGKTSSTCDGAGSTSGGG